MITTIPAWLAVGSYVQVLVEHQRQITDPLPVEQGIVAAHHDHPAGSRAVLVQMVNGQHWFGCTKEGLWTCAARVSDKQGPTRSARLLPSAYEQISPHAVMSLAGELMAAAVHPGVEGKVDPEVLRAVRDSLNEMIGE